MFPAPKLKRIKVAAGTPFFVSVSSVSLSDSELKMLKEINPSGMIYFRRNVESCASLASLIDATRSLESIIFHSIDEEGGRVRRLPDGDWSLPSMKELSQMDTEEVSAKIDNLGKELKNIGINMNMAPNVDLRSGEDCSIVGDRSFGEDPETVIEFSKLYIDGMKKNGINSVIKHFPGHGTTTIDSHKALPVIDKPFKELMENDILPYKKLGNYAGFVMNAHLLHRDISPLPASISKEWNQILRSEIGFNGISMTDDIEMHALDIFDPHKKMELFFESGTNLILVCSGKEEVNYQYFEASVHLVEENPQILDKLENLRKRV
jgi:beta-N-acetylhexosaminidase